MLEFKVTDVLINQDLDVIDRLMDLGVLPDLRIDQGTPNHDKGLLDHTMSVVSNVSVDPVMKMAAFFHDCGKPSTKAFDSDKGKCTYYSHDEVGAEIALEYLSMMGVPYRDIVPIVTLVRYHMRPLHYFNQPFGSKGLRRLVRKVEEGGATMSQLMELNHADIKAHSKMVIDKNLPMHYDLRRQIDQATQKDARVLDIA
jgi:putative nucleotidyltransferase with HDIG domain